MNTAARYIILVFGVVICIHYILSFTHEGYGKLTSLSNIQDYVSNKKNGVIHVTPERPVDEQKQKSPHVVPSTDHTELSVRRANASFVILARNSDTGNIVKSIREMEERFNRKYRYPYVFLNEVEFDDDFKKRVTAITDAQVEFGLIPHDHWFQPAWIDETRASASRKKMEDERIIYGGSLPYRNMCRFNSGFFFKHPLLLKYRWYWRIEPDVHFHCDVNYDPFLYMEDHGKTYGFTITLYEYERTIPTLWGHVRDFMKDHPEYIAKDNAMGYMSDNGGEKYNLCHFWSNFEIADMDFWRGEAYQAFFSYLESKGGFYYERWGDAPVHSIAAGLFLPKDKIHFFSEMGYEHAPYTHCPRDEETWKRLHCSCDPKHNFDYDGYSCMKQWERIQ